MKRNLINMMIPTIVYLLSLGYIFREDIKGKFRKSKKIRCEKCGKNAKFWNNKYLWEGKVFCSWSCCNDYLEADREYQKKIIREQYKEERDLVDNWRYNR